MSVSLPLDTWPGDRHSGLRMVSPRLFPLLVGVLSGCSAVAPVLPPDPILPHDYFTIASKHTGEPRPINVYLPPDIIRSQKTSSHRSHAEHHSFPQELLQALTRKQLLVLERMTKGESNKQIAYNLDIAETTVKAHVSAILQKLDVDSRTQAVIAASRIEEGQFAELLAPHDH